MMHKGLGKGYISTFKHLEFDTCKPTCKYPLVCAATFWTETQEQSKTNMGVFQRWLIARDSSYWNTCIAYIHMYV